MSIIFRKDGTELLLVRPKEFRRIYTLNFAEGERQLEYSHSDVLIELENGAAAMLEIVQSQLNSGSYNLKFKPTETTIDYRLSKNGEESMKYLKRLVFMNFPDLATRDVYLNVDLEM